MSDGIRQVTIPRNNPIKAFTMGGIVQDAGLTVEEFRKLLYICFRYDISKNNTILAQENEAQSIPFLKEKLRLHYVLTMILSTGFVKL
jgi:hypothetical protein